MIGRCYYQLSGFEDNRKNPIKALEYEIKAYNYISQTQRSFACDFPTCETSDTYICFKSIKVSFLLRKRSCF